MTTPGSILNKIGSFAVGGIIGLFLGFCLGQSYEAGRQRGRELKAANESLRGAQTVVATQASDNARAQVAGQISAIAQSRIQRETANLVREVPAYVSPKAAAACTLNPGFVRLYDRSAALAGAVLPSGGFAPGQPNDAPSGLDLAAVTGVLVENNGACASTRKQLIDLQAWIAKPPPLTPAEPVTAEAFVLSEAPAEPVDEYEAY